jgi:hypothetical protein
MTCAQPPYAVRVSGRRLATRAGGDTERTELALAVLRIFIGSLWLANLSWKLPPHFGRNEPRGLPLEMEPSPQLRTLAISSRLRSRCRCRLLDVGSRETFLLLRSSSPDRHLTPLNLLVLPAADRAQAQLDRTIRFGLTVSRAATNSLAPGTVDSTIMTSTQSDVATQLHTVVEACALNRESRAPRPQPGRQGRRARRPVGRTPAFTDPPLERIVVDAALAATDGVRKASGGNPRLTRSTPQPRSCLGDNLARRRGRIRTGFEQDPSDRNPIR